MTISNANFNFLDRSGEISSVSIPFAATDASNVVAQSGACVVGGALCDALAALSLATFESSSISINKVMNSQVIPTSPFAQRELGILVTYEDNTTHAKYRITVPAPNMTNLGQSGTDMVNTSHASWTAFKTAFEAIAKSPVGNAVTIVSGRIVGRNR